MIAEEFTYTTIYQGWRNSLLRNRSGPLAHSEWLIRYSGHYRLDERQITARHPAGTKIFSSPKTSWPALRITQRMPGAGRGGAVSLAVEKPQRKVHHPPACNTENRNAWIYTSSPLYAFMESTGIFYL